MQHQQQRSSQWKGILERGARLEEPFEEANSAMLAAHQAEHIGIHRFHEGFNGFVEVAFSSSSENV